MCVCVRMYVCMWVCVYACMCMCVCVSVGVYIVPDCMGSMQSNLMYCNVI